MAHTPSVITHAQYLQLLGLQLLAANHWRAMKDLMDAALAITDERDHTGDPNDCGHTMDALYDPEQIKVDDMLKRLNITVAPGEPGGWKS